MTTLTTLIPAFRAEYLEQLLSGLASQTFRDFKVVISDDSKNQAVTRQLQSDKYLNITKNLHITLLTGPGCEVANYNRLVRYWSGKTPFAHIHHDDDYLLPGFYEAHVNAHQKESLLISGSARYFAGQDGVPCVAPPLPDEIDINEDFVKLDSAWFIRSLLVPCRNWFGEVSNMVWSSDILKINPYYSTPDDKYFGLGDMALLLNVCSVGCVGFIPERHSVYRIHPLQCTFTQQGVNQFISRLCWISFALTEWREGRLSSECCKIAVINGLKFCLDELGRYDRMISLVISLFDVCEDLNSFDIKFKTFWSEFLIEFKASNIALTE